MTMLSKTFDPVPRISPCSPASVPPSPPGEARRGPAAPGPGGTRPRHRTTARPRRPAPLPPPRPAIRPRGGVALPRARTAGRNPCRRRRRPGPGPAPSPVTSRCRPRDVAAGDVGWIRHQHVEPSRPAPAPARTGPPGSQWIRWLRHRAASAFSRAISQGRFARYVRSPDLRRRRFPSPGTPPPRRFPCRSPERGRGPGREARNSSTDLHQVLRLRPRDEDIRRHPEIQRPELPRPGHVGHRLGAGPAGRPGFRTVLPGIPPTRPRGCGKGPPATTRGSFINSTSASSLGALTPASPSRAPARRRAAATLSAPSAQATLEVREPAVPSRLSVIRGPLRHFLVNRPDHAVAWSASAWWNVISPSIRSFTPPSITWSSLYRVRLIRWSVTRPWGKL